MSSMTQDILNNPITFELVIMYGEGFPQPKLEKKVSISLYNLSLFPTNTVNIL